MINLITTYGVKGYVNGVTIEPNKFLEGSTKPNSIYALWSMVSHYWSDKELDLCIYFGSMTINIFENNSAFEMWKSLEISYVSTFETRIMEIKLQFQTTRKDNPCVLDYFDKMKALVDELFANS